MNTPPLDWLVSPSVDPCEPAVPVAWPRELPSAPTPLEQLGKRLLVLAPHPDDEVFGVGGTLHLLRMLDVDVRVVVLTQGAGRAPPDQVGSIIATRQAESREASLVLGGYELHFEAFADGRLSAGDPDLYPVLNRHLQEFCPSAVAVTGLSEVHPDHANLGLACLRLLAAHWQASWQASLQGHLPWDLIFYEIGPWLMPTDLVDITSALAIKHQAMIQFKSELVFQDYPRHIRALNQLRSYSLPKTVLAAEAFCRVSKLIDPKVVNSLIESETPVYSQGKPYQRADTLLKHLLNIIKAFRG